MATVEPMEIGLVVWAEKTADETLKFISQFRLRAIQLGIPPSIDCASAVKDWKTTLANSPIVLTSAVCCYEGEDYSNLERVHESVGFTNAKYRPERIARTKEIASFAREFGIRAVSCHIGFIPAASAEPLYAELIDVARDLCDAMAKNGQNFVLETGQESAPVLLQFFADVDRANLKINFDPANLILYGYSDPVQALKLLQQHVVSVHCKDGRSPAGAGLLGHECALGDGEVDFPAFIRQLKQMNYTGPLTIEREEPNLVQKTADIHTAIQRLEAWKAQVL
ncbi:sugar phosphate isomerase/epimerase family protein [Edaphobacter flagellatus]|uniref:sugar phosphate isomerase/epimerase family protein n=1 Tax=Edaphobacter flagellatus TaxID=1933044 RepID=UPI0021B27C80|nr:sugar phosphate isomerase/epimerase family protein [Edaphobacter flagellatus]